jgi:hypothetical protein
MDNWVQNLYDLVYQWSSQYWGEWMKTQPGPPTTNKPTGERQSVTNEESLNWARQFMQPPGPNTPSELPLRGITDLNLFRATQALYHRNGWPDNWDREVFLADSEAFEENDMRLQNLIYKINPQGYLPGKPKPGEGAARLNRLEFLQDTAGELALML